MQNLIDRLPKTSNVRVIALRLDPRDDTTPARDGQPRTVVVGVPTRPAACLPDSMIGRAQARVVEAERRLGWTYGQDDARLLWNADSESNPQPIGARHPVVFVDGQRFGGKPEPMPSSLEVEAQARRAQWDREQVVQADGQRAEQDRLDQWWQEAVALRDQLQAAEKTGDVVRRAPVARLIELTGNLVGI